MNSLRKFLINAKKNTYAAKKGKHASNNVAKSIIIINTVITRDKLKPLRKGKVSKGMKSIHDSVLGGN